MHVGSRVHRTVAFVGLRDVKSPGHIDCHGTAFFVAHEQHYYLLTSRHVVEPLEGSQLTVRVNGKEVGAGLLHVDDVWQYHPDPLVDLAAIPFLISGNFFDVEYIRSEDFLTEEKIREQQIDVGDFCYTVGLFKFVYGTKNSFPLVHTGHICLMPPKGEKIPITNKLSGKLNEVETYLIEGGAMDGASGSPVFARASYRVRQIKGAGGEEPILADGRVQLLGMFAGNYMLPPDDTTAKAHGISKSTTTPLGIGLVVPAYKILELLNVEKFKGPREEAKKNRAAQQASRDAPKQPKENDGNPNHKEDFTALLGAAARKQK